MAPLPFNRTLLLPKRLQTLFWSALVQAVLWHVALAGNFAFAGAIAMTEHGADKVGCADGEEPASRQEQAHEGPRLSSLIIDAVIDGSDELVVDSTQATWIHREAQQPTEVALNGFEFDVRRNPVLHNNKENRFLHEVKFNTARIASQMGRNPVVLTRTDDSIRVQFNDPQVGGGRYRVQITFDIPAAGVDGVDPPVKPAPLTDEPADPAKIERPEYAKRTKIFTRAQSTVQGLVVKRLPSGQVVGFATDIIATVVRTERTSRVRTIGDVGPDMQKALDEAVRAVKVRYPQWEAAQVEVSFEDKYSSLDGGSAGTAFALTLLSGLEGWEIDPHVAITGDIAVNWKILAVGAVSAKIRGAAMDEVPLVLVPADSAGALGDLVVLDGYRKSLAATQVFTVSTLQEAVSLARQDKRESVVLAIQLYDEYRKALIESGDAYLRSDAAKGKLARVIELAPNHLSAQVAMKLGSDELPAHLSRNESIAQIVLRSAVVAPYAFDDRRPTRAAVSADVAARSRADLRQLAPLTHPDIAHLLDAFAALIDAVDAAADSRATDRATSDRRLDSSRTAVRDALQKIQTDRDLIDKMIREGG